jgi:hypothetical protein
MSSKEQPQVLRLRLAQKTRQSPLSHFDTNFWDRTSARGKTRKDGYLLTTDHGELLIALPLDLLVEIPENPQHEADGRDDEDNEQERFGDVFVIDGDASFRFPQIRARLGSKLSGGRAL